MKQQRKLLVRGVVTGMEGDQGGYGFVRLTSSENPRVKPGSDVHVLTSGRVGVDRMTPVVPGHTIVRLWRIKVPTEEANTLREDAGKKRLRPQARRWSVETPDQAYELALELGDATAEVVVAAATAPLAEAVQTVVEAIATAEPTNATEDAAREADTAETPAGFEHLVQEASTRRDDIVVDQEPVVDGADSEFARRAEEALVEEARDADETPVERILRESAERGASAGMRERDRINQMD